MNLFDLRPWQLEVLTEILKEHINDEVNKRAKMLKAAEVSKREPRESTARYQNRIESLHDIYRTLKGDHNGN